MGDDYQHAFGAAGVPLARRRCRLISHASPPGTTAQVTNLVVTGP
jgi:hypothetical protein